MQLITTNVFPVPVGHSTQSNGTSIRLGLKYCPSMDLVAVFPQTLPSQQAIEAVELNHTRTDEYYAEDDEEILIEVYRLNGQKVFTVGLDDQGGSIGVVDVAWRDDGVIFAVVTSDNTVRLVNSFSGKVVHTLTSTSSLFQSSKNHSPTPKSPGTKRKSMGREGGPKKRQCMPSSIHYSTHFSDPERAKSALLQANKDNGLVLDDLLSLNADVEQLLKFKADLPKEFANIDVEQYLPKLATLPANSMGEDDVFSTRISIDAMFHSTKPNTRSFSTDIVTVAQTDAHVHLRIYDSFEVGDIDLDHAHGLPSGCTTGSIKHVITHPLSGNIYLVAEENSRVASPRLTRSQDNNDQQHPALHLIQLDLHFLRRLNRTLPILATKATQLHNLIRYLQQIETQLAREVKAAFDLPRRFIRTLEEELKEQDGEGSTFEMAAFHVLLTGQVHGKFKEWLVEILGDRGIKRWEKAVSDCLELVRRLTHENWSPAVERAGIVISRLTGLIGADGSFGIGKTTLDKLRSSADVMGMLGEDLLRNTSAEIVGFNAFIAWLKREIEMAGLEDTSEKLDEMREGSNHAEVRKVMMYISERLNTTSVKKYLDNDVDHSGHVFSNGDGDIFQKVKQSRKLPNSEQSSLPMKVLLNRLAEQCRQLFQQVATQLEQDVVVQHVCKLVNEIDDEVFDSRLCVEYRHPTMHLIGRVRKSPGQLCWIQQPLGNEDKRNKDSAAYIKLEDAKVVLDVRMIEDKDVLVLATTSLQTKIISINLEKDCKQTVRHVFGSQHDDYAKSGLQPWRMEVNTRKGRRTVTVLDEQGRGYGVFDLDSSGGIDDEEGVDEMMQ